MEDGTGIDLEALLEEARKEIDYYKRLAREAGRTRLRETEELSGLIRELRKVRQDLEQERQRFQSLAEDAPYAVAMISSGGRFLYANPKFSEMFGYDLSDIPTGRDWFRRAYPDSQYRREVIAAWLEDISNSGFGEQRPRVFTVMCKDGRKKVIHFRPVQLQTGEHVMTCEDITDRTKAEEALRESEERFRQVSESSGEWIWEVDASGLYLYCSPAVETILGYLPDELVGHKRFFDLFAPDVREELKEAALAAFERKEAFRAFVNYNVHKNGNIVVLETSGSPVLDWEDNLRGYRGADRDITERKKAEEALRQSEERYRALYEDNPSMYFTMDAEGTVLCVNRFGAEQLGYSVEELVGQPVLMVFHPDDRETVVEQFGRCLENPLQVAHWEFRKIRKDGKILWVKEAARASFAADGNPVVLVVCEDITERKQAEEEKERLQAQLFQAQKMQSLGTLAGGIAHDFNNLLQVIVGYSDMLLFNKKPSDRECEGLHSIRQAGRDGAELAKRILAFSRRLEPDACPVNLNNEIVRVQKMLERTLPKMIRIEILLADNLMTVNADSGQMEQILLNLAVNAQHAMPDGGRLTIETANVILDEDYSRTRLDVEPGRYVLLSVSDTGHGMDKEVLEHIFEPFYTTKGTDEGTGLGLAMVFGIVKSHKGHIACYSEPGAGTRFKIYLPTIVQEIEEEVAATQQMPAFGTETILLVDDEKAIRKLGEEMLRMAGYTVLTATNGREALEIYRSNQDGIALVLLDLIMPEMGGKQCLEELLKINPRVIVLIASGYSVNGPTKDALASGARGFVDKPYGMKQVLKAIRQVLDAE